MEKRLRLSVSKSNRYIYVQLIDDQKGVTLASASTLKAEKGKKRLDQAFIVGEELAKKAVASGIKKVWFDRGKFRYHGRIKALADGARKGGLIF